MIARFPEKKRETFFPFLQLFSSINIKVFMWFEMTIFICHYKINVIL